MSMVALNVHNRISSFCGVPGEICNPRLVVADQIPSTQPAPCIYGTSPHCAYARKTQTQSNLKSLEDRVMS